MKDATQFCNEYIGILETLDAMLIPDYYPALRSLYKIAPQDLVTPEKKFASDSHMIGFVLRLVAVAKVRLEQHPVNRS